MWRLEDGRHAGPEDSWGKGPAIVDPMASAGSWLDVRACKVREGCMSGLSEEMVLRISRSMAGRNFSEISLITVFKVPKDQIYSNDNPRIGGKGSC
jgi:hypothetical protein